MQGKPDAKFHVLLDALMLIPLSPTAQLYKGIWIYRTGIYKDWKVFSRIAATEHNLEDSSSHYMRTEAIYSLTPL